MRKFLLINFIAALFAVNALAQSNATYAVVSAMPHADVTNSDLVMFAHYNGSKYIWNTAYRDNFFAAFTNTATGIAWWQMLTNAATKPTLNTTSNALQTQITANLNTGTTASNALQTQITANLNTGTTASNALQTQITANLNTSTTASNALQTQITANLNSATTASNSLQTQVSLLLNNTNPATFSKVTTTNVAYRVVDLGTNPATTVAIDLSLASFQILAVTNKGATTFVLTNYAPGQAVHVLIKNGDTTGRAFNSPVTGTFSGSTGYTVGAGLYQSYQFYSFGNSAAQTATYESH